MPDMLPVLGPSASTPALFHAFRFSGHGFQLGPGVGAVLAELALDGETKTPISKFKVERFEPSSSLESDVGHTPAVGQARASPVIVVRKEKPRKDRKVTTMITTSRRKSILLAAIAAMTGTLCSFTPTISYAGPEEYKLVEPGKLTIATTAEMPGIVPQDGKLVGYDGEILQIIAEKTWSSSKSAENGVVRCHRFGTSRTHGCARRQRGLDGRTHKNHESDRSYAILRKWHNA